MVIGPFPVAKLGVLAVKQISKPLAEVLKQRAKSHRFFRHYVCMPPAQLYNWIEVKTKMWALNLGKPVEVPRLNETMAIELGANLLGEFIIFSIGAITVLLEYKRQVKKEAKKEEKQSLEKSELTTRLAEMGFRLERQDAQLRELTRVLSEIESRSIFRWTRERLNDYPIFNPEHPNQTSSASSASSSSSTASSSNQRQRPCDYSIHGGYIMKALNILQTQVFHTHKSNLNENKMLKENNNEPTQATWDAIQYMEDYDPITIDKQRTKLKN